MEYKKLVAVTGMSGLFELLSSKSDGGLVRSLEDKSTKFVSNRVHAFSHLDSIEVYTTTDNVNLSEVFTAMKNSTEPLPDPSDNAALKAYFSKVFPAMDFERVYGSDMKKMVKWFDLLTKHQIEIGSGSDNAEEGASAQRDRKTTADASAAKAAPVKNAPAKKINAPRKMA